MLTYVQPLLHSLIIKQAIVIVTVTQTRQSQLGYLHRVQTNLPFGALRPVQHTWYQYSHVSHKTQSTCCFRHTALGGSTIPHSTQLLLSSGAAFEVAFFPRTLNGLCRAFAGRPRAFGTGRKITSVAAPSPPTTVAETAASGAAETTSASAELRSTLLSSLASDADGVNSVDTRASAASDANETATDTRVSSSAGDADAGEDPPASAVGC